MPDPSPNLFMGADLVDGCCPSPRPVDIAFLDRLLVCKFDRWDFNFEGEGLLPSAFRSSGFVLAVDGPQGLAGAPSATMRACEKIGGVAGKSPYDFPRTGIPFGGFVTSSVRLFATLWRSGAYHLHGFPPDPSHQATLIEVYPGKAWHILAKVLKEPPPSAKKQRLAGRLQRQSLLEAAGLRLPSGTTPTHDQLDAALAALIALRFANGECTRSDGVAPFWDESKQVLREGFIIYP